jgi:hypothetical protein
MYGEHPRHYVAVDCVIFGYMDGELKLLLYPRSFELAKGTGRFWVDSYRKRNLPVRLLNVF